MTCWDRLLSERVVAPVVVISLHALLVADVVVHQHALRDLGRPGVAWEWLSVVLAVCAYLCTVLQDPGFLTSSPGRYVGPPWPITGLCRLLTFCVGGLLAFVGLGTRCCGLARTGCAQEASQAAVGRDGAPLPPVAARTRLERLARGHADSRELMPIGRSQMDLELEVDSDDPGEETIDFADIEAARGREPGDGPVEGAPPQIAPVAGQDRRSLGAVPGSPRPSRGQVRRQASGKGPEQSGHALRFCKVCAMYQPLRTKHCHDCGRCVRTHDHHCPWVGTCVGEGNRLYFYVFLWTQMIELALFLGEANAFLGDHYRGPPVAWVVTFPFLGVGYAIMVFLQVMVVLLVIFHTWLLLVNITTWENISWEGISYLRCHSNEEKYSPFSVSMVHNVEVYCCPPWCFFGRCAQCCPDPLRRTEDGWAIWELGEPHRPLVLRCGCLYRACCDN